MWKKMCQSPASTTIVKNYFAVICLVILSVNYVESWESRSAEDYRYFTFPSSPSHSSSSLGRRPYYSGSSSSSSNRNRDIAGGKPSGGIDFPSATGRRASSSSVDLELFDRPCQCIKLKYCSVFIEILSQTSVASISSQLAHKFRQASCGFRNTEPIVCCPKSTTATGKRFSGFGYNRDYFPVTTEESWVWDVERPQERTKPTQSPNSFEGEDEDLHFQPLPQHYPGFGQRYPGHGMGSRGGGFRGPSSDGYGNKKNKFFFAHFEDPQSHKNCPPSFSVEFDLPNSLEPEPPKIINDVVLPPSPRYTPTTTTTTTTTEATPLIPDVVTEAAVDVTTVPEPTTTTSMSADMMELEERRAEKMALINSDLCGISINTRIIGGEDSGINQFPWMARLAYRNRTSGRVTYRCSGSVISDRYVVTAAHCVMNLVDDLEVIMVRLGELDVRTERDCNGDGSVCTESQDFEIDRITAHSQYDSPKYANDIALIKLRRTTNSSFISPLCLPVDKYQPIAENLSGRQGIIAGWGSMTAGSNVASPLLQWVRLPIVENTGCATSYARFSANSRTPIVVTGNQMCVQGRENMDACQGDSGGPLMSEGVEGVTERFTLLGLVSFGPRTCGVSNFPGVYTRISSYISWIIDNMEM